ncbi:hypothetical protein B7C62_01690 [Kitasatospora albolonga]|uniref:Uncharacterized protein n=1 Tax=Kitasatospora albolonga TaxID=68173 RepID=A0ABC8BLR6_9ACTN|nr:hypothetical protein B7C62_01690 [Kitasatospora albolonga]
MGAVRGVRRWWRTADRREARVTLGALLLLVPVAPAAGWAGGALADASLQREVRAQQEERRAVDAVVVDRVPEARRSAGDPDAASERTTVVAAWRAPDGTPRSGEAAPVSAPGGGPGAQVRIWTDRDGLPVPPPMKARTARTHALLGGAGAFLLAVGCVEAGRRLAVARMVRRRYARLDREWAEADQDWGRAGTGG